MTSVLIRSPLGTATGLRAPMAMSRTFLTIRLARTSTATMVAGSPRPACNRWPAVPELHTQANSSPLCQMIPRSKLVRRFLFPRSAIPPSQASARLHPDGECSGLGQGRRKAASSPGRANAWMSTVSIPVISLSMLLCHSVPQYRKRLFLLALPKNIACDEYGGLRPSVPMTRVGRS